MSLVGCLNRTVVDIKFTSDNTFELGSNIDFCKLVDSVNEENKFKEMKENYILLNDDSKVICNYTNIEVDKVGRYLIEYRYLDNVYTHQINIVDTTKPKITVKDQYEVSLNNEYFDLKTLVKVDDESETEVFINGNYDLSKVGIYEVEIVAIDEFDNTSNKSIKIKVITENGSDDNTSISQQPNSNNVSGSGTTAPQEQTPQQQQQAPVQQAPQQPINNSSSYKPNNKFFSIDNFNTFDEVGNACRNYINEEMNRGYVGQASCIKVKENGIYKGYNAIFE